MPLRAILAAVAATFLFGPMSAWAQDVGVVVALRGEAVLSRSGREVAVARAMRVNRGDEIRTSAESSVQIAFDDRTRVVVGPASVFDVGNVRIGTDKKATRFAVNAVSGTFRFLSGTSEKKVYEIRTPTATMGIRGTEFDFAVQRGRPTSLVTFEGQVRICGRRRSCAIVTGGCAVVQVDRSGIRVPADRTARNQLLLHEFPYVISQETLLQNFRTRTRSCGKVAVPATIIRENPPVRTVPVAAPVRKSAVLPAAPSETPDKPAPSPEPPAPTPEPPAPTPEPPAEPQAGYPGQSGSSADPGPSQGNGHVNSAAAGGKGKGHGKERTRGGGSSKGKSTRKGG